MSHWELGEGTTPREIADSTRQWPQPANEVAVAPPRRRRWALLGSSFLVLIFAVWLNPFIGSKSGHVGAIDAYFSSGYRLGFGSNMVFARAGQKLHLTYDATVKSGNLVIHVWPTGFTSFGSHSLKTIRIDHDLKSRSEVTFHKTGFYRIEIDTFRSGRSFNIDYDISWHVW